MFGKRATTDTIDAEATNADLPIGYDQPDGPYWVEPDLRPHYVADPSDFDDWNQNLTNGAMPTDTERRYLNRKVAIDDAYWQQLIDSGLIDARYADLPQGRRREVVPWAYRATGLLATITDDDRAAVAHELRTRRAAAAHAAVVKVAAEALLYADSVTGEQNGHRMMHRVTLPDGRTLNARTTLGMVALIEHLAVERFAQQTLPDGRTYGQAATDWLDGGVAAPTSRPMIDLSQAE